MGNDLLVTLRQQVELKNYYDSQPPVACPYDGTPLKQGPGGSEVELYCPNGDFQYPRDWDSQSMSGM